MAVILCRFAAKWVNKFAPELIKIPIYNMGEIIFLLEKIEMSKSEEISQWKELILNAVYSGNQDNYTALLQMLTDNRNGI